jgi:hypothetical protein
LLGCSDADVQKSRAAVARRIQLQAKAEKMAAEHSDAQAKRGPLK